jgi:hypothetical protein
VPFDFALQTPSKISVFAHVGFSIANVMKAAKILHSPINAVMAHITKEGLPDEGDKFKCCDPFGMFLFRGDGEGIYLLKTVIKADALEGAKRQEWTAKIGAGGL